MSSRQAKRVDPRVCLSGPASSADLSSMCIPRVGGDRPPIDAYYDAAESIVLLGQPDAIQKGSVLGRLLLLGHVSAVETYVRDVLVRVLKVCAISRQHAGPSTLPLSSLYYYSSDDAPHGIFEGSSLAGAQEIARAVKKATGLDLPLTKEPFAAIFRPFDEICHLRHAVVHSYGSLSAGSVRALGLGDATRSEVELDFVATQQVALICRTLVQELNQNLFTLLFYRWRDKKILVRKYSEDRKVYLALLRVFRSEADSDALSSAAKIYAALLAG